VDEDGYLYLLGKERNGEAYQAYSARVLPSEIENFDQYRFYSSYVNGWQSYLPSYPSVSIANIIVDSNEWLGGYTFVYSYYQGNEVGLQQVTKPYLDGYRTSFTLFTGQAPREFWISRVYQHPEYKRDNGRTILISYWSQQEESGAGLHLVEFEFYE
jgi:hypothetical protein